MVVTSCMETRLNAFCRISILTREDTQYPWGRSSVPMRHTRSTREEDRHYSWKNHQYHEAYLPYPWGRSSVPMSEYHQYPWGRLSVPMCEISFIFHSNRVSHGYWTSSWVLIIFLMGTLHRYCGYASWVLMIFLRGTEDSLHGVILTLKQ